MTAHRDAIEELVASIHRLRYDGSKRPASDSLRQGWPDLGRAWIAAWARELSRDLDVLASELDNAKSAATDDDVLTPLENAFWRLGSGREKLHAIIALCFGVPSLVIGKDKKQTLSFRPKIDDTRAALRELRPRTANAGRLIQADGRISQSLLLRNQVAHSLAPIINAHSLTWYEAALLENGGVRHYLACHLPTKGLDRMTDIGAQSLRTRAQRLAENGYVALGSASKILAELLDEVGELAPPPIIWKATETNECFGTRDEASRRSRESGAA